VEGGTTLTSAAEPYTACGKTRSTDGLAAFCWLNVFSADALSTVALNSRRPSLPAPGPQPSSGRSREMTAAVARLKHCLEKMSDRKKGDFPRHNRCAHDCMKSTATAENSFG